MRISLIFLAIALISACRNRSSQQSATESTATQPSETSATTSVSSDTLCFQQILKRDTTTLRLVMSGTQTTGYLDIHPFQKDRARGPLRGRINGNQIRAEWDRSGEGTVQNYALDLTLKGDAITWHEGERVQKQGVWVLKQPTGGYAYLLNRTACR